MKTVGLILTLFIIVMNSSCSLEKNLHAKRYVIRDNEPTQHGNKVENEKESLALNQVPDQPIPAV